MKFFTPINSISFIKGFGFLKAMLLLCFSLFLMAGNLSLKAQNHDERTQFYEDYKNCVSNKTAIIKAEPALYQEAFKSGWFQQVAADSQHIRTQRINFGSCR